MVSLGEWKERKEEGGLGLGLRLSPVDGLRFGEHLREDYGNIPRKGL